MYAKMIQTGSNCMLPWFLIPSEKSIRYKNATIKEEQASLFVLGDRKYDAGLFFMAFRIFLTGAQKGCRDCQGRLGHMYDDGVGIKSNIERAIYWYKKSSEESDDPASVNNLFLIYRDIGLKHMELDYMHRTALLGDEDALGEINNPEKHVQRVQRQKKNRMFERRRRQRSIEKNKFWRFSI